MKGKYWLIILLLVILLFTLQPEKNILAQEDKPQTLSSEEERAVITPVMGYQGRLVEGGEPVTGTRTMTFRFFDAETDGSQFWHETKDVIVTDGLFQTALGDTIPFNQGEMNKLSETVWLEVEVGGTTLPRQLLMGAPYAFSLAPGAIVTDDGSHSGTLAAQNTGDGTALAGVSMDGTGVMGQSMSAHGVLANGAGTGMDGTALKAESFNPEGTAFYAKSDSSVTTAVINNAGIGPLLKGYDGQDPNAKFTLYNDGTVKQNLSANGLVKAAVYAHCHNLTVETEIYRYYQGVPGADPITIRGNDGGVYTTKTCFIDFQFDISNRFWSASASRLGHFAGCVLSPESDTELRCYIYDNTGNDDTGAIMVLIY